MRVKITVRENTMRILFDSKQSHFKTPFGTLTPGEECTLCIHVPASVQAKRWSAIFIMQVAAMR